MNNVTTFDNFPPFATNGSRNMNTESAKYAVGFLEGETFPAEWANYLFHGATKGVSDLNTAVQSIWKENINVIQGSGQTPSSSDNTQLKTAIELMIQNAVLTANSQVLAQAKLDAHPVGSLYWSSNPTNPSTLFGGTWVQIKGRFIWAKGDSDTVNATGGSATVQLTESNLPAHSHICDSADINHTHDMSHGHGGTVSGTVGTTNTNHTHYLDNVMTVNNPSGGIDGFETGNAWTSAKQFIPGMLQTSGSIEGAGMKHSHTWNGSVSIDTLWQSTGEMSANSSHSHTISGGGNGTASGTAHENMPPYIVKYCWERVS